MSQPQQGDVPFASLLMQPAFRAPFLEGIYEWAQTKAVFKCANIAEQLRDCQGQQVFDLHRSPRSPRASRRY